MTNNDFDFMPAPTTPEPDEALHYSMRVPPKKLRRIQSLSEILKYQFDQPFYEYEGEVITAKEYLGILVMQGALLGRVEFPTGEIMTMRSKEWLSLVKFAYERVDGKPKQADSGKKEEENIIQVNYTNDWRGQPIE